MFKLKLVFAFILILFFFVGKTYSAGDFVYVGSASFGFNSFEFPEKLDTPITHVMAELSATAIYQGFILALSAAHSIDQAEVSEEDETGQADRRDFDLLLGYPLNQNWTLFGGYKKGETRIDFINRTTNNLAVDRYKQSGPYLGASYNYRLQRSGKLAFSAAYASLDSVNDFHASERDEGDNDVEFDDLNGRHKGKTEGFSLVASWSMPLSPQLIYQAKLRYNDYQQNIKGQFEGDAYNFDVPEKHLMLMMGLSKVF